VKTRVAPALKAVAGALTHLNLETPSLFVFRSEGVDAAYELGVAVGELRRLRDLTLGLSENCRVYHAFAQGFTVCGGARPLPLLWRVKMPHVLASLLLPNVRVIVSRPHSIGAALVTACVTRLVGVQVHLGCKVS
jgi:hypothetical protein